MDGIILGKEISCKYKIFNLFLFFCRKDPMTAFKWLRRHFQARSRSWLMVWEKILHLSWSIVQITKEPYLKALHFCICHLRYICICVLFDTVLRCPHSSFLWQGFLVYFFRLSMQVQLDSGFYLQRNARPVQQTDYDAVIKGWKFFSICKFTTDHRYNIFLSTL